MKERRREGIQKELRCAMYIAPTPTMNVIIMCYIISTIMYNKFSTNILKYRLKIYKYKI